MTYRDWLASVPKDITQDVLWRMEVYRLSLFSGDLAWYDATRLMQDRRTLKLSDQLYSAVGSISANIAEGYSRRSHKDQARFYEYALGSAREARNWYFEGPHILAAPVSTHRISLLTQIVRHLLNVIPAERGYAMKKEALPDFMVFGNSDVEILLINVPLPETALDATRST